MKKIVFLLTLVISVFSFSLSLKVLTENEKKAKEIIEENVYSEINKKLNEYREENYKKNINFDELYEFGKKYLILDTASVEVGTQENENDVNVNPVLFFIINENNIKLLEKNKVKVNVDKMLKTKTGKNLKYYEKLKGNQLTTEQINEIQNIVVEEMKNEWKYQWHQNYTKREMNAVRKIGKIYNIEKNIESKKIDIDLNDFK